MARSKAITGYLYERGGKWYGEWKHEGKRYKKVIRDDGKGREGKPLPVATGPTGRTNEAEARALFNLMLAPFQKRDAADRDHALLQQVAGRERDAVAAEESVRAAELAREQEAERLRRRIRIADAWQAYKTHPNRKRSSEGTLRDHRYHWDRFTGWLATSRPKAEYLDDVTPDDAGEFLRSLDSLSAVRYNKILATCRRIYRLMPDALGGKPSPFTDYTRRKVKTTNNGKRPLSEDELREIIAKASGELRTLLVVGAYTGLRLGDVACLRWSAVDTGKGLIRVTPRKTKETTGVHLQIPILPPLQKLLEATPSEDRGEYVMPRLAAKYERNRAKVSDELTRHFKRCEIDTAERDGERHKVGFHSLRHTFVSLAYNGGMSQSVVMDIVGHTDPEVNRLYSHVNEATKRREMAAAMPDLTRPADATAPGMSDPEKLAAIREILAAKKRHTEAERVILEIIASR